MHALVLHTFARWLKLACTHRTSTHNMLVVLLPQLLLVHAGFVVQETKSVYIKNIYIYMQRIDTTHPKYRTHQE